MNITDLKSLFSKAVNENIKKARLMAIKPKFNHDILIKFILLKYELEFPISLSIVNKGINTAMN